MTEQSVAQDLQFGDFTTGEEGHTFISGDGGKTVAVSSSSQSKNTTPAKIPIGNSMSAGGGGGLSDDDSFYDEGDDKANLLNSNSSSQSKKFWSFEYYQSFFDVETHHVLNRIYRSIVVSWSNNFVKSCLRPNPDLYGPFWIAATLVFSIAINGNFSSFIKTHQSTQLATEKNNSHSSSSNKWAYDIDKISTAGLIVTLYLSFVPLFFWIFLRWRKSVSMFSLLEIVCVYGYSLSIFVPASLLWLIPIPALQWSTAAIGFIISTISICFAFWPSLQEEDLPISVGSLSVIVLLHSGLVASFMALL